MWLGSLREESNNFHISEEYLSHVLSIWAILQFRKDLLFRCLHAQYRLHLSITIIIIIIIISCTSYMC